MEEDERRQVILNARAEVERPFASDYVPPEVDALERWGRPRPERKQHRQQESYWQGWTDARINAALERSNKVRTEAQVRLSASFEGSFARRSRLRSESSGQRYCWPPGARRRRRTSRW
jgi:hypothetical protein